MKAGGGTEVAMAGERRTAIDPSPVSEEQIDARYQDITIHPMVADAEVVPAIAQL